METVEKQATKTERGMTFPARAYAYVPDREQPSTWKLRLWQTPETQETRRQIGLAVAALGPGGFRGQRVQIPADDLPAVKRRVLRAWVNANPDKSRADAPPILKELLVQKDEKQILHMLYIVHDWLKDYADTAGMRSDVGNVIGQLEQRTGMTPTRDERAASPFPQKAQKVINYEDGQYCVYSETGRGFGCYNSEAQAQDRLEQIDRFSRRILRHLPDDDLGSIHDTLHTLPPTPRRKTLHDLIEDELEDRTVAAALGDLDEKLEMLDHMDGTMMPFAKQDDKRFTLGPVYIPDLEDAHGEFTDADTLQAAMWEWVRKGDRSIYLQHSDKVAGEMVEVLTFPFPIQATLNVPGQGQTRYDFPADTPYLGVVWEPWAWEMVKAGEIRGYSIGGKAQRLEVELPEAALI
jgi:hypothetical protein